jgi:hypothetical protein
MVSQVRGYSGWNTADRSRIERIMTDIIPADKRRDRLYCILAYQYAANSLSRRGTRGKHIYGRWRPDYAYLNGADVRRIRAISSRATIAELQSYKYRLVGLGLHYSNRSSPSPIHSSPELLVFLKSHDP